VTLNAAPVSVEEFTARLCALNIPERFAIAVSGGRDSMALARLAADYASGTNAQVLALIVDHRLREGSREDAARAARWVESAGLPARILVREGAKPQSAVQAFARTARYQLLADAVCEAGMTNLMTAHSATDQAETVFMRLGRGAGPRGLSAMAERGFIAAGAGDPVRLVRPLLFASRQRLTATAERYGQEYLDDPANDDPAYERVRARTLLAATGEQQMLTVEALCRTAHAMGAAAQRLQDSEDRLFDRLGGCFYRWGGASLEASALQGQSADICAPLMRRIIRAVSGAAHPPPVGDAARALSEIKNKGAASLGGALLEIARGRLWVYREPAAILGRAGVAALPAAGLAPGAKILWDNRFIITNELDEPVSILALGDKAADPQLQQIQAPKGVIWSMPGLWRGNGFLGALGVNFSKTRGIGLKSLTIERFSGSIIRF